jgi:hypothetical protein
MIPTTIRNEDEENEDNEENDQNHYESERDVVEISKMELLGSRLIAICSDNSVRIWTRLADNSLGLFYFFFQFTASTL